LLSLSLRTGAFLRLRKLPYGGPPVNYGRTGGPRASAPPGDVPLVSPMALAAATSQPLFLCAEPVTPTPNNLKTVMPGFVPGIPALPIQEDVDSRDKAGDDEMDAS
jgi:hypothetical protein